jgi:ABC-type branched-subunit amino acid transport system ATPase component
MIEIAGLTVEYGGVRALDTIALLAQPGELIGIVGPNGSGKTTLFDAVCGFARSTSGTISLDGVRIDGMPPYRVARRGVARTHQAPRLFGRMTALENVEAGALARAGSRASMQAAARETLTTLGFSGSLHALARNLTENERRRVETARALVAAPRVALLDEPFAPLDRSDQDALRRLLIAHARERNATILVAERDVESCLGLCDRVVVLHAGTKIADDTPDAVARDPDVRDAYLGVEWRQ